MTAVSEYLSSLFMSNIVWPNGLWEIVGHTMSGLEIWAPQMDVDLTVLCCDDTGT